MSRPRVVRCFAVDCVVVTELTNGERIEERRESREAALDYVKMVWNFDRLMAMADNA